MTEPGKTSGKAVFPRVRNTSYKGGLCVERPRNLLLFLLHVTICWVFTCVYSEAAHMGKISKEIEQYTI